jgi:NAD(P)-dependent dehydrogenase (short-subunit alcohol dehydrogenase family)
MASAERFALITGSSRGIGRGIALSLAGEGVKVAVHYYRNEAAARDTLGQIRKRGSDGVLVQGDVTRPDEIAAIFRRVADTFGRLDVFVANARPEVPAFFQAPLDVTLAQWDTAFDSQAKAFLVGVREALPLMGAGGRILAITYAEGSRTGGLQPWVGMGSAKAAMESLVRYFAVAVARRGITVNAISPGWTEDSVLDTLPPQAQELIRNWHKRGWTPMGRLGTPEDVGNVASLLCSPKASWITGQVLYADGGACLMNPGVPTEIQIGAEAPAPPQPAREPQPA